MIEPRARSSDPETSHEAAASISKLSISKVHLAIMMVLSPGRSCKWEAMTDQQIIASIRAPSLEPLVHYSSVNDTDKISILRIDLAYYTDANFRSRRSELVKLGFVAQSPGWFGMTSSGRRARLWRLTQAGLNHLNGAS